jgi:hypothetical protein
VNRYELGRVLHEARIAKAWGPAMVGLREPWLDFTDPKVLRAYPHNPIAYVDLALAQASVVLGDLMAAAHGNPARGWLTGFLVELEAE